MYAERNIGWVWPVCLFPSMASITSMAQSFLPVRLCVDGFPHCLSLSGRLGEHATGISEVTTHMCDAL